jgi:acetyltransferase
MIRDSSSTLSFERLFNPRGIAIVGASGDVTRFGGQTVRALNRSGYGGFVFPVNPKYREIDGRRCYANVSQLDGTCDLAVIALPAAHVPHAVRECGQRGIAYAIVLGGGFRESGEEGARLEEQMLAAAREHGMRLIGPNCIGLVNPHAKVIAAFGSMSRPPQLMPGGVSAALQSGGFGMSVIIQAAMAGIGFRYVVASGSESDITMPELIEAFVEDPDTKLIFAYIEGVRDGRALMRSIDRALTAGKPVVVWKGGKTAQGERAAQSHTANLTSNYDVYRTVFKQFGALEVFETEDAVALLQAFESDRLPKGRNIAVVTNTGGSAVVFSDAADEARLRLAPLAPDTRARIAEALPPLAATGNPVDTMAGYPRPEHAAGYRAALDAILADAQIDQLCVLLGTITGSTFELSAQVLAETAANTEKPVFAFTAIPKVISEQGWDTLRKARIPLLSTPSRAAHVMGMLADYAEARRRTSGADQTLEISKSPVLPRAAVTLDEHHSKSILSAAGIPVTRDVLLPLIPKLADLANVPFPAALKIVSSDILHKSDLGGVRLSIGRDEFLPAAAEMVARIREKAPAATLSGLLACEMVTDGIETIVGVVNDASFGPVVAFGLGGLWAETLKDVAYRIVPFGLEDARAMISELRARTLFGPVRGRAAVDVDALALTLVKVSALAWALRDRVAEMDINPLLVRPRGKGVVAADALLVLK